jgi:hypothetical protein
MSLPAARRPMLHSYSCTAQSAAFIALSQAGKPWSEVECADWKAQTQCSKGEVLQKLETLRETMIVEQYGALPYRS